MELPEGRVAGIQESFKYLGIPQTSGNHAKDVQRSVADIKISCQWIENVGLKDSTEAHFMAEKEQRLNTKSTEAEVYQQPTGPKLQTM